MCAIKLTGTDTIERMLEPTHLPASVGLGIESYQEVNTADVSVEDKISAEEEEYQTLLKPDGTAVKVKVSALKKSKILKKNVSNESFLNWLGRKL